MMEDNPISLAWCRQHLSGFRKYEQEVKTVREDEQRYRDKPGYVPGEKV